MSSPNSARNRTAASLLTDIRMIIALLFVIYGLVLAVLGAAPSAEDLEKSGGFNVNLWSGLGMLAFAAAFAGWAWLRPVAPADPAEQEPGAAE
ncbi:hypothetical protein [Nocardiopsis composta]|uniref:Preprotein translocase subunit SecG n=1 Tax=Nocardiopsis composta TaxID=157465 RepID=A0A7W8QP63_9ACTN|nr:hypothetical protein [Nocardiopsis composta]MBB5434015.1 preprotein translocase subunit SecG [Nocardiopsis composta]